MESICFSWREIGSIFRAERILADELKEKCSTHFTKQDRQAIAQVMLKCASGRIDGVVSWTHSDAPSGFGLGDLHYIPV